MKKQLLFTVLMLTASIPFTLGQEIATIGEIYDFEVGDEFHTRSDWGPYVTDKIIITITDKFFNSDTDTLIYFRHIRRVEIDWWSQDTTYYDYGDTVNYYNLDSLICNGNIDVVFKDPSEPGKYNGRWVNRRDQSTPPYETSYYDYIEGCGGPYHRYNDVQSSSWWETKLKYFKKGEEEWGEQLVIVGTPEHELNYYRLKIYPNPADNYIVITAGNPSGNGNIQITNLSGQIVMEAGNISDNRYIAISNLKPGIYLLRSQYEDNTSFEKLIIK